MALLPLDLAAFWTGCLQNSAQVGVKLTEEGWLSAATRFQRLTAKLDKGMSQKVVHSRRVTNTDVLMVRSWV